jgi:signal transduction histidine kinase
VVTDRALLGRVIGNMLKNALEASRPGEAVTAGCERQVGQVRFWVHNSAVMPRSTQLQLFQRSFSTKGAGRGLGTYSIKLLGERYLGGRVVFSSVEGQGTTFTLVLPS